MRLMLIDGPPRQAATPLKFLINVVSHEPPLPIELLVVGTSSK